MMPPLEQLISTLAQQLLTKNWKLVTAESCTGGGLSYYLTSLSGSSKWFERGYITYSNAAKENCLGVQRGTLAQFGAVSEQVALEMAEGALTNSKAQLSVAITGIAGPEGGTKIKPVGTVWFGFAGIQPQTIFQLFKGNRQEIREQAIRFALEKLVEFSK